jgi:hypothetical protein
MPKYILLLAGWVLASCSLKETRYEKLYVDLDSLITVQVNLLASQKASAEKKAFISGKEGISITQLDSLGWANELEVFRQLDAINKPTFREMYKTEETKDDRSNLTVRSYTSAKPSAIPFIKFYYLNHFANIKKIEARLVERNTLFFSTRDLTLDLEDVNRHPVVSAFQIRGIQKMILGDTVQFSIETRVVK